MFVFLQKIIPQHLLSRLVGMLAKTSFLPVRSLFINIFIVWFKVDMSEALNENPAHYSCFNDFFTRKLKPDARPIDQNGSRLVSPADGLVSYCGELQQGTFIQAKNQNYSVNKLLARDPGSTDYQTGSFATIYLSPRDYHRVHMPCDGSLQSYTYVPGKLFSVNHRTSASVKELYALNERLICHFMTAKGPLTIIMVGALIVASIKAAWKQECFRHGTLVREQMVPPLILKRGDELGLFQLGSTVIILSAQKLDWSIKSEQAIQLGNALTTIGKI